MPPPNGRWGDESDFPPVKFVFFAAAACRNRKTAYIKKQHGVLAQLARAPHWQCGGQEFESPILHHFFLTNPVANSKSSFPGEDDEKRISSSRNLHRGGTPPATHQRIGRSSFPQTKIVSILRLHILFLSQPAGCGSGRAEDLQSCLIRHDKAAVSHTPELALRERKKP